MDDNIINWNLKGPKRMKKRKELNALLNKDKQKLKLKSSSSIQLFKRSNSSSDKDDFYFAGNKQMIRSKKRKHIFKLCETSCCALLVTICLIINITLIIWNVKYKNEINQIKETQKTNDDQIKANLNMIKELQDRNNFALRKFEDYAKDPEQPAISQLMKQFRENIVNINDWQKTIDEKLRKQDNRIIDYDRLNDELEESLSSVNQTIETYLKENRLIYSNLSTELKSLKFILSNQTNSDYTITDLLEIKDLFLNLTSKIHNNSNNLENVLRKKILKEVELEYIKPIIKRLESCNCKDLQYNDDGDG